ncbi:MAG: MgtC/SapB family protein [Alphaproteobacteria bacterium]|nr:MgtC/SapB family protein [Alphaproteobacteria bacterium]
MSDLELLHRLGLALLIGAVIGLERGWQMRDVVPGARQAGIRTFALYGFLGGIAGWASLYEGEIAAGVILAAGAALIITGYILGLKRPSPDAGMTTEAAGLVTLGLGLMAVRGDMIIAASAGAVTVAVLNLKDALHHFLKQLEAAELQSFIMLMIVSVVMLPLLPDEGFGPGGVLNPYALWWVVVLISGTSFLSYGAIKFIGPSGGALLMGALGGIASSTALSVSAAKNAAQNAQITRPMAAAISLASGVMFLRTWIIASAIAPGVGEALTWPLLLGAGALSLGALGLERTAKPVGAQADIALGAPVDLWLAIKFGAALAAFALAAHYATTLVRPDAIVLLAAISGLVDADATTVTASRQAAQNPALASLSVQAILVATGVNMLTKAGISLAIGGKGLFYPVALMTAIALAIMVGAALALSV